LSSLSLSDWVKGIINHHLSFGIPETDSQLFQIFASVICDLLWFSRSKAAHDGTISDITSLANSIRRTSLDHPTVWNSTPSSSKEPWTPPLVGTFKVNFDTSIRDQFSAQAVVCRNSKGNIVKVISQINPSCDPNYGEALAAQLAVSLAASMNLKNFIMEGDSLVVITALQNPSITQDWHIESIIANTLTLLPAPSLWKAKKVNRSANFCAHHVAYWAAARVHSVCIPTYFPPSPSFPFVVAKTHLPFLLLVSGTLVPSFSNALLLKKKKKKCDVIGHRASRGERL
jgi:hypothetical protein